MEKFNDMQHKKVADDELEQVGGGVRLWNAVTAEYNKSVDKPKAVNLPMEDSEDGELWGVNTLEMRVRKKRKNGNKEEPQVIKL